MWARGYDKRQALLVRLPDGRADDVIAFLLRCGPDEGLLQAIREHDDFPVLTQAAPDDLPLKGRDQVLVHLAEEALPRQVLEVQGRGGVPQPDRHRDNTLAGQQFRQPDQHRGLSRAHTADQDMRPHPSAVQVRHHHFAQIIAAHDLADDCSPRRNEFARLGSCQVRARTRYLC